MEAVHGVSVEGDSSWKELRKRTRAPYSFSIKSGLPGGSKEANCVWDSVVHPARHGESFAEQGFIQRLFCFAHNIEPNKDTVIWTCFICSRYCYWSFRNDPIG